MSDITGDRAEAVIVMLTDGRSSDVLELGCGTGRNTLYLAERGFRVKAVDSDKDALARLEQRAHQKGVSPRVTTHHGSPLDPIEGDWDVIVICFVLHTLSKPDAIQLITRAQAHTKPHGLNAIIGWSDEGEKARNIKREKPDAFFLSREFLSERYGRWHKRSSGHRAQSRGRVLTGLYVKPK